MRGYFFACVFFAVFFSIGVLADEFIMDNVGLLSVDDAVAVDGRLSELYESYNGRVGILTLDTIEGEGGFALASKKYGEGSFRMNVFGERDKNVLILYVKDINRFILTIPDGVEMAGNVGGVLEMLRGFDISDSVVTADRFYKVIDLIEEAYKLYGKSEMFMFQNNETIARLKKDYWWIDENNSDGIFFVLEQGDKSITMKYDEMADGGGDKTWWFYVTSGEGVTRYKTVYEAVNEKKINPLPQDYEGLITSFSMMVGGYEEGVEMIIEESFMRMGSSRFFVKKKGESGYINDFSWDDSDLIELWVLLLDVKDYDSAMRECDERVGDYSRNKIFIEYLFDGGLITKWQRSLYSGRLPWYPDLYKLKKVLEKNKESLSR